MIEEDEIDLRPYIMTMLRRWKLIVGLTVVAAAVAAAASLTAPVQYEASTTVAVAPVGAQPTPGTKPYIDLATSDAVVAPLARELASGSGSAAPSAADLKGKLRAAAGSEARLVTLTVRDTNPAQTTGILSAWAPIFVQVVNSTLNSSQDALKELENQSRVARQQLGQAEDELAAQEGKDSVALLETQVDADQRTLEDLIDTRTALQSAGEQAAALRTKLGRQDAGSRVAPADELAAALIVARLVGNTARPPLPDPSAPSGPTVGAEIAYLDGLSAFIANRSAEVEGQIPAARAALLGARAKLQRAQDEQAPLLARRDNLRKTITDLELKADQLQVATAAGTNQAQVLAGTQTGATALSRGTTRNVAVAVVLGLMVGVVAALGAEWLATRRGAAQRTPSTEPPAVETGHP